MTTRAILRIQVRDRYLAWWLCSNVPPTHELVKGKHLQLGSFRGVAGETITHCWPIIDGAFDK